MCKDVPLFEEIRKMDMHAHVFHDMPGFIDMLRRRNFAIVNVCFRGTPPETLASDEAQAEILHEKYGPHVGFASTFDLTRRDKPDFADTVIDWLDKTFDAGAVMVKLWKDVGMELKTPAGDFLMPDDPVFDPIYAHMAKRGKPLLMHCADPLEAWEPLNPESLNYHYYSHHPEWHVWGRADFPSHEDIMRARDNLLANHTDLRVIGAHLGSMEHDLDLVAQHLDRFPNFHVDVAARTPVLKRLPIEQVRQFFIKYQNRILYGTDTEDDGTRTNEKAFTEAVEHSYRADFHYYAETLNLPREVLQKFYSGNAERLWGKRISE